MEQSELSNNDQLNDRPSEQPEYLHNDEVPGFRIMPFSNEAEQSVLGAMIINRDVIAEVSSIIHADDLYIDRHKIMFEMITELFGTGKEINFVTLKDRLEKHGSLDAVGGMDFVFHLMDLVPSTEINSVRHYAGIIREKAELRRLISLSDSVSSRSYAAEDDVDEIIASAEQGLIDITKHRNMTGLTHISVYLDESIDKLEQLADEKQEVTGLSTGFADLDKRTAGLHSSEFILIAGRPGMGKSTLALNIAQNAALIDKATVAIFSLEMPGIQIANRMISGQAMVPAERLKRGDLKDEDWPRIGEALAALAETNIYIDDNSSITSSEIASKCRKLKLERGLDLVVIDYLQLLSSGLRTSRTSSRQQEVSDISRMLKILANDLEIPVIALSQLNRSVEKRDSKEPVLSDLRESGSIEQDADVVIFLYREGYYKEDCEEPNKTKIKFEKHRNGEVGYEYLTWLGEYTKFSNWSGMRDE